MRVLREADRLLAEGSEVSAVAKALEVSEQTFHRWRAQYGGMKADDAKRLRELEREKASRPLWWAGRTLTRGGPISGVGPELFAFDNVVVR